jgi:hypothetical protein
MDNKLKPILEQGISSCLSCENKTIFKDVKVVYNKSLNDINMVNINLYDLNKFITIYPEIDRCVVDATVTIDHNKNSVEIEGEWTNWKYLYDVETPYFKTVDKDITSDDYYRELKEKYFIYDEEDIYTCVVGKLWWKKEKSFLCKASYRLKKTLPSKVVFYGGCWQVSYSEKVEPMVNK